MADELDERLPHSLPEPAVRRDDVRDAEDREKHADPDDLLRLQEHVLATEARQAFVPNRRQQLLHVRMCHELEIPG